MHTPHAVAMRAHPIAPKIFDIWANWDGAWYLLIAHQGYQMHPAATAFFPGYPMLVRLLGGGVVSGMMVSGVASVAGLGYLWKITTEVFDPRAGWYAVLGLVALPTAFFYGAVYSDGLYFGLATATFYHLWRRQYRLASILSGLASAVSIYGLLLSAAISIQLFYDRRARSPRTIWTSLALAPLGLLLYMAFQAYRFGQPLLFDQVQQRWKRHPSWPWFTLEHAWTMAWKARRAIVDGHLWVPYSHAANASLNSWNLGFYAAAVMVALTVGRRLPLAWQIYLSFSLLVPLVEPSGIEPLMSFPRLLLQTIPIFPALGVILQRFGCARVVYLVLSVPLSIWMIARFVSFHWVA